MEGAEPSSPVATGEIPLSSESARRGSKPKACGGNHKWGFPLLCCTPCRGKSREIFTARPRDFGAARCRKKGKNHKWGFSLFSPAEKIHPFRALIEALGVSPSAGERSCKQLPVCFAYCDQHPTALDPCRFLKKRKFASELAKTLLAGLVLT